MMCVTLAFDRPLSQDAKTGLLLAIGALAKTRRVRFAKGDYGAMVYGEAIGTSLLLEALAAEGVVPSSVTTSLDELGASLADDQPDSKKERVRAIGR